MDKKGVRMTARGVPEDVAARFDARAKKLQRSREGHIRWLIFREAAEMAKEESHEAA